MEMLDVFNRDGFLVLPGFYSNAEIDAALNTVIECKKNRPVDVSIDFTDHLGGSRTSLTLLTEQQIAERHFKINDLYLVSETIRHLGLNDAIEPILRQLLGTKAVLCNSLNMDYGSSQLPHVDALYMTPQTPGHLIAIWVALEDAHEDAGQLEYFPGSHVLPQYLFSTGSMHYVPEEMDAWTTYMNGQVSNAGLARKRFGAKKGDVLIWHAHLLHGGSPINDRQRTRKSLVFHYYSLEDCRAMGCKLRPQAGSFWMDRAPAEMPHDVIRSLPFSEDRYLARYPDVAHAVAKGHFASGAQHYESHGKHEGRLPR